MKTWLQSILLLRDDKQQVVTNGYPYLRVDSIVDCTVKGLDVQVLLDPLEEDPNLPSFLIQLCNSDCINREVISEESIDFVVSKVLIYNKYKVVRILLRSIKPCKLYRLIGDKSRLSINFPRLDNCVQHIILGSGDKPLVVLMKVLIERVKLHVALIHNLKSRPIQLLRTKIKSSLNISQATAISELCKAHYQKLISATELYGMSVTFIPFDALAEFILGEERRKLRKDCFAFIHGLEELALMPFRKLTSSNRKIIFAL